MIGNDIVSLDLVRKQPRVQNDRFVRKVLHKTEQEWVWKQTDPEIALWSIWALKESAYKAHFKCEKKRYFAPLAIHCFPQSKNQTAQIHIRQSWYQGKWELHTSYLHAFAWTSDMGSTEITARVIPLTSSLPSSQSLELKSALLSHLSSSLACLTHALALQKETGIPRLYHNQIPLPIDLSLSHHEYWGGYTFVNQGIVPFLPDSQTRSAICR